MSKTRVKSTANFSPAPTYNEWVASVLKGYQPSDKYKEAEWGDLRATAHRKTTYLK